MRVVEWQAIAGGSGFIALVALLWIWRTRRQVVRRMASVISRLESVGTVDVVGKGRLEASMAALERAASTGALRISDAEVSVERFSEAFDALQQGVLVCDELGDFVFRNERFGELIDDDSSESPAGTAVARLMASALSGEEASEVVELSGRRPLTVALRGIRLVNHSKPIGAVVVAEDISHQRRLEGVRRDFVSNLTHEVRTPVDTIRALAETLASADDPTVTSTLANRVGEEAHRVGRVVDALLDLDRVESQESPRREAVALHIIVAEAAQRVREAAEQRGIALAVHEPPKRLRVLGDRRQLVSAVENLLDNAVAYSESGGSVTVETRTNGTWVEVTVADHGVGIPTADLDRIFERFYRTESARSRERGVSGGSGLGLSIVRHIAGAHGGEVRVQSKEGSGSTFTIRLPAGPGPVAVTAEAG